MENLTKTDLLAAAEECVIEAGPEPADEPRPANIEAARAYLRDAAAAGADLLDMVEVQCWIDEAERTGRMLPPRPAREPGAVDAIVSGSARIALLRRDGQEWLITPTRYGGERRPARPGEFVRVLGDAGDLAFLRAVDEAAVQRELDTAHAAVEAFHLALMALDRDTSAGAVALAIDDLDELFANASVVERVRRILIAVPRSAPFDDHIAVERCDLRGRHVARDFFVALAST